MRPDEPPDHVELNELLGPLDHPVPAVSAKMVVARARRTGARRLRWAAGVALAFAVAASAANALPGSPLRGWIASAWEAVGPSAPTGEAPGAETSEPRESSGIALAPGDFLLIRFVDGTAGAYARVELTDGAEVVVSAPAGSTRFTSEPERLLIEHPSTDTVRIFVPRASPRVEIEVGTRRLLQKIGAEVSAVVTADSEGAYVVPLGGG